MTDEQAERIWRELAELSSDHRLALLEMYVDELLAGNEHAREWCQQYCAFRDTERDAFGAMIDEMCKTN